MRLSKLILDEMVQGIGDHIDDWEFLLLQPNREQIWNEAVKRREQLNRFCYFAAEWPMLVSTFKKTKAFVKDNLTVPKLALSFDNSHFLTATLNKPTSDINDELLLDIGWGDQQLIEVKGPQQISFNSESLIRIHYSYCDGVGWLTSDDSWDFQPNEGAVLLTFLDGGDGGENLELQVEHANSVSKIVLIPA